MARDDVPASLRRILSGTIPYAEQSRSTVAEEVEPLPVLTGDDEEQAPIVEDDADMEQKSDSSCFTVYVTMSDGFLAAITLTGRSAEVGSLNKLSLQDRIAFAAADEKEWNAILDAGAVRILSPKESDEVRRSQPDRIITSRMIRRLKPGD